MVNSVSIRQRRTHRADLEAWHWSLLTRVSMRAAYDTRTVCSTGSSWSLHDLHRARQKPTTTSQSTIAMHTAHSCTNSVCLYVEKVVKIAHYDICYVLRITDFAAPRASSAVLSLYSYRTSLLMLCPLPLNQTGRLPPYNLQSDPDASEFKESPHIFG
jgi:hypothetical protein